MRIEVSRGREPLNLCRYLLQREKREPGREEDHPVFHTNMFGETAEQFAQEFEIVADLNPRVQKIVTHYAISFPPGEDPDLNTKREIATDLLQLRGHHDCIFFAVEHFDRQQYGVHHFHVAVSPVRFDGTWVSGDFERLKLKGVESQLEQKYNLTDCPSREPGERRNLTTGESRMERRTGEPCLKRQLWDVIDNEIAHSSTLPILVAQVKADGYEVKFREFEDGGKGLSFGADGKYFQGRQLGDRYSFTGLQRYAGVSYQSERDDELLRELTTKTAEQCRDYLVQIQQPQPHTDEWSHAEFLLNYASDRLNRKKQTRLENERYWTEQDESGTIQVGRKIDGQVIAQGQQTENGWVISCSQLSEQDRDFFRDRQQKQGVTQSLQNPKEVDL